MQTFIHITRAHNEVSAALYMFDYICDPPEPKDFDSDREVLNNLLKSIFAWYLMNILKYIIEWSLLSATIFWKSLLWNLRFLTMWSVPMGKSTILHYFTIDFYFDNYLAASYIGWSQYIIQSYVQRWPEWWVSSPEAWCLGRVGHDPWWYISPLRALLLLPLCIL